jgi:hypothetical protein
MVAYSGHPYIDQDTPHPHSTKLRMEKPYRHTCNHIFDYHRDISYFYMRNIYSQLFDRT